LDLSDLPAKNSRDVRRRKAGSREKDFFAFRDCGSMGFPPNRAVMKLILASGSPRRSELLRVAGLDFEVRVPDIPETVRPGEGPAVFAERMALEKARTIDCGPDEIVLAADTVVCCAGAILGKPRDAAEAVAMLERLSGRWHEVVTGFCLRSAGKETVRSVVTRVEFRSLGREEIEAYVRGGEPMDKAGAYAIQSGAAGMVRRIEGSHTNVIGLPVCEVLEALKEYGT